MTRRQAGIALAVAHVALVGSLGLKLLVDRARFPRGWARTLPYDPSTPFRGRYVRLALDIPLGQKVARGDDGYTLHGVRLKAVDGRIEGAIDETVIRPRVTLQEENGVVSGRLTDGVAFFIPEHVPDPSRRANDEQLWVEVTLPPGGQPRPIRLGVMKDGRLTPLELR